MATQTQTSEAVDYSKLWWVTLLAGVTAAGANVLLYIIAQNIGFVGDIVPSFLAEQENIPHFAIATTASSIIFIAIGGAVMWIIDRFSDRPITTWRNVAIVALILSLGQPIFGGFTGNDLIIVEAMHIIAGIIAIAFTINMVAKDSV
ncbi:MAG: DUF6069 family protein [Chloroflexota bacterium]